MYNGALSMKNSRYGKQFHDKLNVELLYDPSNSTPRYISKTIKN